MNLMPGSLLLRAYCIFDLRPRGGGAKTKLDFRHLLSLAELIAYFPGVTLERLRKSLHPPSPCPCLRKHDLAQFAARFSGTTFQHSGYAIT
jgi:hypothetical protein